MGLTNYGEGSVYRDGQGWRVAVYVDGKRKVVRAKTKAEALQKRRELYTQKDSGTLSTGKGYTLTSWLDHWLNNIADIRDYTKAGYQFRIKQIIDPTIGKIQLEKLRPEHLEALYVSMKDGTHPRVTKPLAPAGIRQTHSIIRRALKIANQRGLVSRNVALLVDTPSVPKQKTEALSTEDAMKLLQAAKGRPDEARWVAALLLGLRPGEALGLTWDCIDFDKQTLTIKQQLQTLPKVGVTLQSATKTDAGAREIPIPEFLVTIFQLHKQEQERIKIEEGKNWVGWAYEGKKIDLVFTQRSGQPIPSRLDTDRWADLLKDAGLHHTRRYTARHTAATLMLDQINDIAVVASILGHTDPSFTYRTYVHPMEDKKRELADKMGAFLA